MVLSTVSSVFFALPTHPLLVPSVFLSRAAKIPYPRVCVPGEKVHSILSDLFRVRHVTGASSREQERTRPH